MIAGRVAQLASMLRVPMPRGFMPLWVGGRAHHQVQCIVDEFAPPMRIVVMSPNADGRFVLSATSETWAANGAHMLARAYLPEGVP